MSKSLKNIIKVSVFGGFVLVVLILTSQINRVSAENFSYTDEQSLKLVNSLRKENGLNSLKWNDRLASAAYKKAVDMENYKYFDHISPKGKKAWDFVISENYQYSNAGENLALDFDNVKDATNAWENSPLHLRNMVSSEFDEFGFAQLNANIEGHPTIVYVQIFAKEQPIYDRMLEDITN